MLQASLGAHLTPCPSRCPSPCRVPFHGNCNCNDSEPHSFTHTHTVKTRIVPRLGKHPRATRWRGVRGGGGVKCNFKWSPNGQLFTVVALFACLPIVGVRRPLLLLPLRTINFNCCLTRCWVIKLYFNTANRSTNVLNSQEETKVHKVLSFHRFIYYSTLIYSFIYEYPNVPYDIYYYFYTISICHFIFVSFIVPFWQSLEICYALLYSIELWFFIFLSVFLIFWLACGTEKGCQRFQVASNHFRNVRKLFISLSLSAVPLLMFLFANHANSLITS